MSPSRPIARRAARFLAAVVALGLAASAAAADSFPFDQDLLLDVTPMRPVKKVPMINIAADGSARLSLWCKTVRGQVQLNGGSIRVEAGPLPDALPQYMSDGQCTPERMEADRQTLVELAQVTGWSQRGNVVTLSGPTALRFRVSDH